jgi:hypothetical protein
MKTTGIILTITTTVLLILSIAYGIIGTYQYENRFESYWSLADKSSTITKKAEYIDKFVNVLDRGDFKGKYNAIFLTTPNNSFDQNFEALKTLQKRLHEISGMDVTSFEYQTAIQQITGQEQGEAQAMMNVFDGIWWKDAYPLLWNWIGIVQVILCLILLIVGIMLWSYDDF